jgi:hypothetical protein
MLNKDIAGNGRKSEINLPDIRESAAANMVKYSHRLLTQFKGTGNE